MNFYEMPKDLATKKLFFVQKKQGFGKNKALQTKKALKIKKGNK